MKTKETFASLMNTFEGTYDLCSVFDDVLTLSIALFSMSPLIRFGNDQALYFRTMDKYKYDPLRFNFQKMLSCLSLEMTARTQSKEGNDILGKFYEARIAKPDLSQFFTPYPICNFMVRSALKESEENFSGRALRILDPACGSGRFLVIAGKETKSKHQYLGIDIDLTCVKMAALNLFLSGVFSSEVMCANALITNDFRGSYVISYLPFGIFRIEEKEKSFLWRFVNDQGVFSREKVMSKKNYN